MTERNLHVIKTFKEKMFPENEKSISAGGRTLCWGAFCGFVGKVS